MSTDSVSKGRSFQRQAAKLLSYHFHVEFRLDHPILIGTPRKEHRFDLVSTDLRYVGECKSYSWTESGNVPSAKIGSINEAVFYLSFLPSDVVRFVVMRKEIQPKRGESLADYYYRIYHHLLKGVSVIELDVENDALRELGRETKRDTV